MTKAHLYQIIWYLSVILSFVLSFCCSPPIYQSYVLPIIILFCLSTISLIYLYCSVILLFFLFFYFCYNYDKAPCVLTFLSVVILDYFNILIIINMLCNSMELCWGAPGWEPLLWLLHFIYMLLVFVTFAVCMRLSSPEGPGRARVSWNEPAASLLTKTSERCTNVAICFRCANKLFGLELYLNPDNTLGSFHVNADNEVMLCFLPHSPWQ